MKKTAHILQYKGTNIFDHVFIVILLFLLSSCKTHDKTNVLFDVLNDDRTGLYFTNRLTPTQQFNMFTYMYFYNGAGVGAADFNNDGLIDLFFASNQQQNKLFLNTGNLEGVGTGLKFKDVTAAAKIPNDGAWSTGVSVVDINNDGLIDIYVCRVGNYEILHSHNQLLICKGIDKNGIPSYKDEAHEYGLDFSGFSTQAAFFDYDMDGDLDMYLLNHSVHQNGNFAERKLFLGTYNPLSGDRIYRNNLISYTAKENSNRHNISPSTGVLPIAIGAIGKGEAFSDVTKETGINSSAIGYGLGICVANINLDGYPDIYIGNDFHENDYLYINQKNGTFKEDLNECMMHTSQFSMGVDVADINNDAYPEIISMDMLPSDPYMLKRSLGEDEYNTFYAKIGYGYNYQYTRNNLQLNCRNGMFSEVGLYAGVAATDWSWSPLWVDFDNDGLKDLFISNGIPKRLNDIDYVNYVSNDVIQEKIRTNDMKEKDMTLIDKFPEIKLTNRFFKNNGNAQFTDVGKEIKNEQPGFSNGAVYADFDNDGDLDIAVNTIDAPVLLYQNKSNDAKTQNYLQIKLKGAPANINAIGAKIILFANGGIRTYESFPVKGFQSSMQIPLQIGFNNTKIDSMFLVWPDNTYQSIQYSSASPRITFSYKNGLPAFDYKILTTYWKNTTNRITDVTKDVNLQFLHKENPFNEFDRELLIPHTCSAEGPALAVDDMNGDGLDDVFIGSSKREKSAVFMQTLSGKFQKSLQPAIDRDSVYEDVDACWVDVNNDKHTDLVVASGGNEYYGADEHLQPRVYLNDGKANLTKLQNAFDNIFLTASCIVPYDFTGDGYVDLFVGGRAVPWEYGQMPTSYLLQNDGTGKFNDVTVKYSKELSQEGFITSASWIDLDKDGDKDLILSLEWDGIIAYINNNGSFIKKQLTTNKGWWNFVYPCDIDNDGDIDFITGNLGLNTRLKASQNEPVKMYYGDFDGNGKKEQVLTYYLQGKEIPFANKAELEKQMPVLKKKFLYASDLAKASLKDIFTKEKLNAANVYTANYFSNAVLINEGNFNFTAKALPWRAQLSSFRDATVINANNDSLPDILLVGNFYGNNIEMGRYDADYGTLLINHGNDSFTCESMNGLQVKGETRHVRPIKILNHQQSFVLARNNDSAIVITTQQQP